MCCEGYNNRGNIALKTGRISLQWPHTHTNTHKRTHPNIQWLSDHFNGLHSAPMSSSKDTDNMAARRKDKKKKEKKENHSYISMFFFSIDGSNILSMLSMSFKISPVTSELAGEQRVYAGLKRNRAGMGSRPTLILFCWIGESILISGAFSPFANTRYEAISMPALNIAQNNEILSAPKQDQTFPH